ncbi:hypothetical protein DERP_015042 [Dermatophagoides pteronyssinus]|uniref:Uncharacterized protein n=1 Tax=Dermatophagoides pteronyssinus TaxID=6956 RepID=A0ABQ8JCW9_DERPT|nr:hypothetical protein DERP_015042 [Dermatophagoides pteronyssinus]
MPPSDDSLTEIKLSASLMTFDDSFTFDLTSKEHLGFSLNITEEHNSMRRVDETSVVLPRQQELQKSISSLRRKGMPVTHC